VVWRIAVEDFTYSADALIFERVAHGLQQSDRCFRIAVDAVHSEAKGSKQPAPNRSLVIATVALPHRATISRTIRGVAGLERTQPESCDQVSAADPNDTPLIFCRQRTVRKADREDLVRPDAGIRAIGPIDYIV
jgi:hypothetical protein